ncbi:MAG: hypothetical protein PVG83_05315 [Acidimicrobiia bacterium]
MRFPGELKFPDLDHPGVPVEFHIEGAQAELKLEGESLGKWSLYDVRADRLIASAFLVKLGEDEVTFVADDPIDFAYRGVEHMANTWAGMKAKRIGARGLAVSRSRRGTIESRLDEVRQAMEENLGQRPIAGEPVASAGTAVEEAPTAHVETATDWDRRDEVGEIPSIGEEPSEVPEPESPAVTSAETTTPDLTEEQARLEDERRRLEEERAELERQRAEAEQREANLFEAYRLEVQRLEAEREELRRQAAMAAERAAAEPGSSPADIESIDDEFEDVAAEPEEIGAEPEEVGVETEPVSTGGSGDEEPVPEAPIPSDDEDEEKEPAADRDEERADVGSGRLVDLKDFEDGRDKEPPPPSAPSRPPQPEPQPETQPALAGASAKEKAGLMGAVRAAFRGGARDHEHQFTEAPGGLGITRYVCEDCGYVSISVGG